ncbi:hypothetical protein GCM10023170_063690 [Phytohabitans houttuyneae]
MQEQRAAVGKAVHDKAGRAPGGGGDRADRQPLQALVGEHIPDRAGEQRLLCGAIGRSCHGANRNACYRNACDG